MALCGQLHFQASLLPGKKSIIHWLGGSLGPVLEKRKMCGPIEIQTSYRPPYNHKILSKTSILRIPNMYFQLFFPVTNNIERRWIWRKFLSSVRQKGVEFGGSFLAVLD